MFSTSLTKQLTEILSHTTARNKHNDPTYWSVTFDMYLVVEHFIGRHEYDVAGQWRASHPEMILECQDAFSLDWTMFYQEKDTSDPVWSGKQYDFKVTKVPKKDWQKIANQVAHYLGFMNDINEQTTKHSKGKRKAQDNAASAGPSKKTRSKTTTGPSAATAGPSKHK